MLRDQIDRFEANWESNAATDPDNWPDELSGAGWHEQFIAWLELDELDDES